MRHKKKKKLLSKSSRLVRGKDNVRLSTCHLIGQLGAGKEKTRGKKEKKKRIYAGNGLLIGQALDLQPP